MTVAAALPADPAGQLAGERSNRRRAGRRAPSSTRRRGRCRPAAGAAQRSAPADRRGWPSDCEPRQRASGAGGRSVGERHHAAGVVPAQSDRDVHLVGWPSPRSAGWTGRAPASPDRGSSARCQCGSRSPNIGRPRPRRGGRARRRPRREQHRRVPEEVSRRRRNHAASGPRRLRREPADRAVAGGIGGR